MSYDKNDRIIEPAGEDVGGELVQEGFVEIAALSFSALAAAAGTADVYFAARADRRDQARFEREQAQWEQEDAYRPGFDHYDRGYYGGFDDWNWPSRY